VIQSSFFKKQSVAFVHDLFFFTEAECDALLFPDTGVAALRFTCQVACTSNAVCWHAILWGSPHNTHPTSELFFVVQNTERYSNRVLLRKQGVALMRDGKNASLRFSRKRSATLRFHRTPEWQRFALPSRGRAHPRRGVPVIPLEQLGYHVQC
jgi:hypothetical protein